MRIGLTAGASTPDKVIAQAQQAEAEGFSSIWYASGLLGDPLVAMAFAGRATTSIELGTAVLQTYPCHPVLQARRAASVVAAMGRPGFSLGLGPSHEPVIRGTYGLSFDHPGRSTEEYIQIVTALLRGEGVDFEGEDWTARVPEGAAPDHPVPVLLSALSPRLLRIAGELTDGTVLWMAPPAAVETHVAPKINAAAEAAGRPAPRIVAGLPVAVHDDEGEAREAVAATASGYEARPIYRRILDVGGAGDRGGRRHCGRRGIGRGPGARTVRRRGDGTVSLRRARRCRPPRLAGAHDRPAQQPGPRRSAMTPTPPWSEPRTAIVTGGASGIGLAISQRLASDGATVAIFDVNGEAADAAAAGIEADGGRAQGFAVDVSERGGVDAAVAEVRDDLGAATILVNNAGISPFEKFQDITEESFRRVLDVNLVGLFGCCQAVAPDMIAAGWGRIVNIASSSAQTGSFLQVHYSATKGGVIALTRSLAQALGPKGITVNAVPPSLIDTPALRAAEEQGLLGPSVEAATSALPVRRVGEPEDIAAACAYLARDDAGFVTGQVLGVNGGRVMQ